MRANALILSKRLFRKSFFSIGTQQRQENWDERPNSPVVSPTTICTLHLFSMVMCTIGVEYQHVDRVSLKRSVLKGKVVLIWQMHTTHNAQKWIFYSSSAQSLQHGEKQSWLYPELSNAGKKKVHAKKKLPGHSPSLRSSTVLILLRPNSPAFPLNSG